MIMGYFSQGEQIMEVTINGNGLQFKDITNNNLMYPNFTYLNVIKQFPDLKDDKEWQVKAGKRFIEFFHKIEGEMKRLAYIKEELIKQGYSPMYWKKQGFRTKRFA
jgi:hypothetical protein